MSANYTTSVAPPRPSGNGWRPEETNGQPRDVEMAEAFSGRWRMLIVAVPVLAALGAGVWYTSVADTEYEASGVLNIAEFSAAATPGSLRATIDDFDSALGSRAVASIVEDVAPDGDLRIDAEVLGEGGDVRVTYSAPVAADAEQALDEGVRAALTVISEAERRQLTRQLEAADTEVDDAVGQLLAIEQEAGSADLAAEAARRSADLLALRNQIAAAAGTPLIQDALEATLEAKEAELALIEEQLLPWTGQRARFDVAVEDAAAASLRLRQISTNQADLRNEQLLQSARVNESSTLTDLLRVAVGAAVVTAVVMVAFALLVGGRRREQSSFAAGPASGAGGGDASGAQGDTYEPEQPAPLSPLDGPESEGSL